MTNEQRQLIAELEAQEETLVFPRFDNTDAWQLGSAMVIAALARGLPVTIDIRRHGQQLSHAALPGTTAENDAWIERKINVVKRFGEASYLVGRRLAATDSKLDEALGVDPIHTSRHTAERSPSTSPTSASLAQSPSLVCPKPKITRLSPRCSRPFSKPLRKPPRSEREGLRPRRGGRVRPERDPSRDRPKVVAALETIATALPPESD